MARSRPTVDDSIAAELGFRAPVEGTPAERRSRHGGIIGRRGGPPPATTAPWNLSGSHSNSAYRSSGPPASVSSPLRPVKACPP